MKRNREKKRLVKRPGIWSLVFLLNLVFFFFLALAFGREYVSNKQIEQEIARSEAERTKLEQENLSLNSLITNLSSEYFLEKEGRTKHGLAGEGETLLVIKEDETGVNATLEEENRKTEVERSNPEKWFVYFFGEKK